MLVLSIVTIHCDARRFRSRPRYPPPPPQYYNNQGYDSYGYAPQYYDPYYNPSYNRPPRQGDLYWDDEEYVHVHKGRFFKISSNSTISNLFTKSTYVFIGQLARGALLFGAGLLKGK